MVWWLPVASGWCESYGWQQTVDTLFVITQPTPTALVGVSVTPVESAVVQHEPPWRSSPNPQVSAMTGFSVELGLQDDIFLVVFLGKTTAEPKMQSSILRVEMWRNNNLRWLLIRQLISDTSTRPANLKGALHHKVEKYQNVTLPNTLRLPPKSNNFRGSSLPIKREEYCTVGGRVLYTSLTFLEISTSMNLALSYSIVLIHTRRNGILSGSLHFWDVQFDDETRPTTLGIKL